MSAAQGDDDDARAGRGGYDWSYLPRGMARIASIPAIVLISAFVGFGALTRELGIPLAEVVFMVPTIWALPSHLIVVAGLASGTSLVIVAFSVALASVRMMPMTMALVPQLRIPQTRHWHLFAVANMVAITAWAHLMERGEALPRRARLPYFVGFAGIMMLATTITAATVHISAAAFPAVLMAALYFLTPIYFTTSIWKSARIPAERLALVLGLAIGPLAIATIPEVGLLVGGIASGALAYLWHWLRRQR